jgi:hypothetical protein
VSSYAGGSGEALPWGLLLVEGIVVALFGLILLVAPGASLFFLVPEDVPRLGCYSSPCASNRGSARALQRVALILSRTRHACTIRRVDFSP